MARIHNIHADGSWRYSGKHEKYPVQPGETWQVGKHLFICADVENTQLEIIDGHTTTFMYADPPYSGGVARSYRTKAGIDGDKGREVNFRNLIQSIIKPASVNRTVAYLETGVKSIGSLETAVLETGAKITGKWDITFYGSKPAVLIAADFRESPAADHPDFTGKDDADTPSIAIQHWKQTNPDGRVTDSCAGRGLTARSAEAHGYRSLNVELSPFRMAEALDSVSVLAGIPAERIL
jgi:hypothetical protein